MFPKNISLTYRIIGDETIVVVFDYSDTYTIDNSNPNFDFVKSHLLDFIVEDDDDEDLLISEQVRDFLINLMSDKKRVQNFLKDSNDLTIDEEYGIIKYRGEVIHNALTRKILAMLDRGMDAKPLINFLKKLQANPDSGVKERLFEFLDYGKNAFSRDGDFLAYKYVSSDYKSVHDGKTAHSLGLTVRKDRATCDPNPDNTCSHGLHCCSIEYLGSYTRGYRIVCVKVNPTNVVAVPRDYNNTKMRVCEYKVVGELDKEQVEKDYLSSQPVIDDWDEYNDDDYDHWDDVALRTPCKPW